MAMKKKATTSRVTSQPSGYQSRFAAGNAPKDVKTKVEQKGTKRTITYTQTGQRPGAKPSTKKNPFSANFGRNK